jgi:hypothetical protein
MKAGFPGTFGIGNGRGFAPVDVENCVVWLDGSDSNTLNLDSSNNVADWLSKAPGQLDASQSSGSLQPNWVRSALNDKGSINFDGGSELFALDDTTFSGEFTVFWVADTGDLSAYRMILGIAAPDNNKLGIVSPGNFFVRILNGGSSDTSVAHPAVDTSYIGTLKRDSANKVHLGS